MRPSASNGMGSTQERTGRWTSPRCQFLRGINPLVIVDTLTGLIAGFPTWTEKAKEVEKLLDEITLRTGLPRSLQSDNGTPFTSKVTQEVSKALGITYYLHCVWTPQSSGKVERANQFLKSVIKR